MTGTPDEQVLTEVPTVVHPSRQEELVAGSAALLREPPPDGLVRTELLRVDDGWRIQTLWRDREALAAMRSSTAGPAAPRLFGAVGAERSLTVLGVHGSPGA